MLILPRFMVGDMLTLENWRGMYYEVAEVTAEDLCFKGYEDTRYPVDGAGRWDWIKEES